MIELIKSVQAWGSPDFETALKQELQALDRDLLPLQQGLSHSSHVSDAAIGVTILKVSESGTDIHARVGIMYAGIIAGSCCSDDPTPLDEQPEYCELQFDIDRDTGKARVSLAGN